MVAVVDPFQYFIERPPVGIGDKNLAKFIARNQFDNFFHPVGIQPVEDIVQQQNGCPFPGFKQVMKLCQLHRYEVGFVLPLRTHFLYGKSVEQHLQFIAVNTGGGVSHRDVATAGLSQRFPEIVFAKLRNVVESRLFVG
ncbi:hypothetical protein SDC9_179715 [bioreactor metagenome]|uniref:Uncharacterized protein n=1 Tax=bioreactor metagenome TaxID=1076179 RepID=A0A645H2M9_9ZZZZ